MQYEKKLKKSEYRKKFNKPETVLPMRAVLIPV